MTKTMKKTLVSILLLLATGTAFSQVPLLKKPVLAPQVKPAIKPLAPIDRSAILKARPTVTEPPSRTDLKAVPTTTAPSNRTETARGLKAQNVPVEAALAELRKTFGSDLREESNALRLAGYPAAQLVVAMKQAYDLQPDEMLEWMPLMGVHKNELARQLRILYALDFDPLLATLRGGQPYRYVSEFGYALDAMDYTAEKMVEMGYRYFVGGFPDWTSAGTPFPSAKRMYSLLMLESPLRDKVQVDHYALFQLLMASGYSPQQVIAEVPMGRYIPDLNLPMDEVSTCIQRNDPDALSKGVRDAVQINPQLVIQMAPDGTASHPAGRRSCIVKFLGRLRANGTRREVASVLANLSVSCLPATNIACPEQRAAVVGNMLNEAGFGS